MDTEKTNQETILVVSFETTTRTSQKNGRKFKAKVLKTDKLGTCSITEFDKGFECVEAGGTYICTYSQNDGYKNIRSIRPIDNSESEDDGCLPIDFDIEFPVETKQQANTTAPTTASTEESSRPIEPPSRTHSTCNGDATDIMLACGRLADAFKTLSDALGILSNALNALSGKIEALK